MSQLFITRTGPPTEVVELRPQIRPVPGPGEVLIRMQAAAINPADLNFIEGTYGKKPVLPCVPGMKARGSSRSWAKESPGGSLTFHPELRSCRSSVLAIGPLGALSRQTPC